MVTPKQAGHDLYRKYTQRPEKAFEGIAHG